MGLKRKQLLWRARDIFSSLLYIQLHAKDKVKVKVISLSKCNALQAGRPRVRFPTVSLEFVIDIILPGRTMVLGLTACNRNEYQEYFLG